MNLECVSEGPLEISEGDDSKLQGCFGFTMCLSFGDVGSRLPVLRICDLCMVWSSECRGKGCKARGGAEKVRW